MYSGRLPKDSWFHVLDGRDSILLMMFEDCWPTSNGHSERPRGEWASAHPPPCAFQPAKTQPLGLKILAFDAPGSPPSVKNGPAPSCFGLALVGLNDLGVAGAAGGPCLLDRELHHQVHGQLPQKFWPFSPSSPRSTQNTFPLLPRLDPAPSVLLPCTSI